MNVTDVILQNLLLLDLDPSALSIWLLALGVLVRVKYISRRSLLEEPRDQSWDK